MGLAVLLLPSFPGCWFTDQEFEAAWSVGNPARGRDTGAGDTDTAAEPYTCTEGGSAPNVDAPGNYTTPAGIEMVGLPSGSFCMGSESADAVSDEQPVHPVTLTRPFWIGRSEVTQAEYEALTGETPSYHEACSDCPVEQVSWSEAVSFANAASEAEGLDRCYITGAIPSPVGDPYTCEGYRLPTEAEWEYAARAGDEYPYAGSGDPDAVAWTSDNSGDESHEVCSPALDPNAWGLCDMSGNVWEWVGDWYDAGYYAEASAEDPLGAASGSYRADRGGSWNSLPASTRVANRGGVAPDFHGVDLGLRLARAGP